MGSGANRLHLSNPHENRCCISIENKLRPSFWLIYLSLTNGTPFISHTFKSLRRILHLCCDWPVFFQEWIDFSWQIFQPLHNDILPLTREIPWSLNGVLMHPGISSVYTYEITSWPGQNVPGGTPLFKPYRYVPPQGYGFLRRFGLKSGIIFERITAVYERIYRFNSKWERKKEKYANSKRNSRNIFWCCCI